MPHGHYTPGFVEEPWPGPAFHYPNPYFSPPALQYLANPDVDIRELERASATGDPRAQEMLWRAQARTGEPAAVAYMACGSQSEELEYLRCARAGGYPPFVSAFQSNWNKQDSAAEYMERALQSIADGRSPGFVGPVRVTRQVTLTPQEWDEISLMGFEANPWWLGPVDGVRIVNLEPGANEGIFRGGSDSLADLPDVENFWELTDEQKALWRSESYPLALALTDGQRTVFVDPQGYEYGRYAYLPLDMALPAFEAMGWVPAPPPPDRPPLPSDVVMDTRSRPWIVENVQSVRVMSRAGMGEDWLMSLSSPSGDKRTQGTMGGRGIGQGYSYPRVGQLTPVVTEPPPPPPPPEPSYVPEPWTAPPAPVPTAEVLETKPGRPIRLGTKRSRRIFEQTTRAVSYTLSGNFEGQDMDLDYVRRPDGLEADARRSSVKSMRPGGGDQYTIRYHSNHWVEFWSPGDTGGAPARKRRKRTRPKAGAAPATEGEVREILTAAGAARAWETVESQARSPHAGSATPYQVENLELDRLQIKFPRRPGRKTRKAVREAGFRWAPVQEAWQLPLGDPARAAAERVEVEIAAHGGWEQNPAGRGVLFVGHGGLQVANEMRGDRPFRAPHYTAPNLALGQEVDLARGGILVLDEAEMFRKHGLEIMRHRIEQLGDEAPFLFVVVSDARGLSRMPAWIRSFPDYEAWRQNPEHVGRR